MSAKITPLPWGIYEDETIEIFGNNELSSVCTMQFANEEEKEMAREEAKTIVSAVNNTYGAGINPEAVPELVNLLKRLVEKEEKAYKGRVESANHFNNNADGVGVKFDYETPVALPKWVLEAKAAIEKATIKP
jgi:hypothetical protein